MEHLAKIDGLKALYLTTTQISPAGRKRLQDKGITVDWDPHRWLAVEVVRLGGTFRINVASPTDPPASKLAELPPRGFSMTHIDLSKCQRLTAPLAPHLMAAYLELNLSGSNFDDKMADAVSGDRLFAQKLILTGSKVTDAGAQRLKAKMPNCQIVR